MAENESKNEPLSRDELNKEEYREEQEQIGPLDVPQYDPAELRPTLFDRMQARQSVPLPNTLPHREGEPFEKHGVKGTPESAENTENAEGGRKSPESIMQRRWRKFKSLKRGYYSFLLLIALYILSFFLPLLVNNMPLYVSYNGNSYFPAFADLVGTPYYPWEMFGREGDASPVDFRELAAQMESAGDDKNSILMPLYSWGPYESDYEEGVPPNKPSERHVFGTDDIGRDVFSRMCYGFNISISFGLALTIITFAIGTLFGAFMGYFGGKFDLFFQRGIEIWQTLPALYVIIIVSSIIQPSFLILVLLLTSFGWMGMTYYMRGEFYREKAKDYVAGAISLGTKDSTIIFKHILPNSLTPLIATFPFAVVAGITSLVSLDFLGYGLPPPTSSWGQMINVGLANFSGNFQNWWLVVVPVTAMFFTLLLVTFIGESIREAFDPKVFSRLR